MGSLNCNQTKCLKKNKITIDIDLIDIPTDCFQQSNFNRAHFHILKSILNSFPHFGIVQISRAHRQSSAKKRILTPGNWFCNCVMQFCTNNANLTLKCKLNAHLESLLLLPFFMAI